MEKFIFLLISALVLAGCQKDDELIAEKKLDSDISLKSIGNSHVWTHGDWSSRILYEARYALSSAYANGYSSNTTGSGIYQKWYGDWDYTSDDIYARDQAEAEGYGIMGLVGPDGSYYLGGECTYFVRLILFRSTYWNFNDHYAMPNYPGSVYDQSLLAKEDDPTQFQPGWVLFTITNRHYAISEKRATIGGVSGWWVIDSNWVRSYTIGKHFMSDTQLINLGYRGMLPDLGTDN